MGTEVLIIVCYIMLYLASRDRFSSEMVAPSEHDLISRKERKAVAVGTSLPEVQTVLTCSKYAFGALSLYCIIRGCLHYCAASVLRTGRLSYTYRQHPKKRKKKITTTSEPNMNINPRSTMAAHLINANDSVA